MKKLLVTTLAVVGLTSWLLAQVPTPLPEKPAAAAAPLHQVGGLRFVDQAEVSLVNVDVSVRDKKGDLVTSLTAADFEVFQDRKAQAVTNFAVYTRAVEAVSPTPVATAPAAPTPAPPAATPTPAPEPTPPPKRDPRFLALYIDNENLLPQNRNRVLGQITEWISNQLREPDQAMVVSYQRSLKVQQAFTSDPEEVASALRKLKRYTGGRSQIISERKRIEEYIAENSEDTTANAASRALGQVESFAKEQRNELTFAVRSIQELVVMMSGLPGKKTILYVSDGLPMSPGLELYYEMSDKFRNPSVLSQSRTYDSTDLFRGLVTSATAAGVTMYAVDAQGLDAALGIEAENRVSRSTLAANIGMSNYQDSLIYMAEQTGGMAVLNANNVTEGLERIADDIETYYSIGYRLVPSGQDRMHRIEVKVKGHPEYKLKYRPNFIEKTLPSRIGDRVVSGLAFDLEDNPLGIKLETGEPAPSSADRWTLPVEIKVPLKTVALVPDGDDLAGYVMAYYAARDDEGKQSDLQRVEHAIRIPAASYDEKKGQYVTIAATLLLEPGTYRISVGVRDQLTNQAGYALLRAPVHPELR